MDSKSKKTLRKSKQSTSNEQHDPIGYPLYPIEDDVYMKLKNEKELDPEDPTKKKTGNEKQGSRNEKDFNEDPSGSDLDIPGVVQDDQGEVMGNEDEENNYFSLGGDNHSDLDEN